MQVSREKTAENGIFWKSLLAGSLIGVLTTTLGLLLSALLMTFTDMQQGMITVLAVVSAVVGAFMGGMCAARVSGSRGWLLGSACGMFLFVLVLIAGLFMHRGVQVGFLFVKLAALLFGGMCGGMIGVNKK